MVENSNIISALLERLNDFPHVRILDNTTIEEITYGPDTGTYDLTGWPVLRNSSGPIAARLLVGADGPNSLYGNSLELSLADGVMIAWVSWPL